MRRIPIPENEISETVLEIYDNFNLAREAATERHKAATLVNLFEASTLHFITMVAEGARHLPAVFKDSFPFVKWDLIKNFRNTAVHSPSIMEFAFIDQFLLEIADGLYKFHDDFLSNLSKGNE